MNTNSSNFSSLEDKLNFFSRLDSKSCISLDGAVEDDFYSISVSPQRAKTNDIDMMTTNIITIVR